MSAAPALHRLPVSGEQLCAQLISSKASVLAQVAVVGITGAPRSHIRCSMLCVWLHPHAAQIRHLHIEAPLLEGHPLRILLRQLCSLESLCVVHLDAATAPDIAHALQQSRAPITAFHCSGSCWPSWLPCSIERLELRLKWPQLQAETHEAAASPAYLLAQLLHVPGLQRLCLRLSGRDPCAAPEGEPACASTEVLQSLVRTEMMPPDLPDNELQLLKLQELVIVQELEQADWEQRASELQARPREERALLYMTGLHDEASYNMHVLQHEPDCLPALRLARVKTSLQVASDSSESVFGGSDASKQHKLLVHSLFLLHARTLLRQIDSQRQLSSEVV